jgi:hypothetical protein
VARLLVPLISASVFVCFHLLTIVWTLISSGGHGEGQAFAVLLLDFPLVLLLQALPSGGHILYGSVTAYVWFFSIAGTLMYAAFGYFLGVLLRAVIRRVKKGDGKSSAV